MKKIYYPEISYIRGIACLLVILTHVTLSYPDRHQSTAMLINLTANQFARVGTPIFAVISGFLLFNSTRNRALSIRRFYQSRIDKIVIPYLFWTMVYLLVRQLTEHQVVLSQLGRYLLFGEGYVHLYFIIIVIQFYIIFPFFSKRVNIHNITQYTCVATILNIVWLLIRDLPAVEVIQFKAFILNWIAYFFMGGWMAFHMHTIQQWTEKHAGVIIALVLISLLEIKLEMNLPDIYQSDRLTNLSYVPIFTLFFFWCYSFSAPLIRSFLTYIGNRSMGFYLVHLLVIGTLTTILPAAWWQPHYMPVHYILVIIGTILAVEVMLFFPYSRKVLPVIDRK